MADSRLLSLPLDLQEIIVLYVCKVSIRDLFSLKMTCRMLREISESPSVYRSVDLFTLSYRCWNHSESFMKKCFEHENPSAIYMKGSQDYFLFDKPEEGLARIKLAADKGYTIGLYTYAMLRKIFWDDGSCIYQFSRENIRSISGPIVVNGWGWSFRLRDMVDKKTEFNSLVLHSLYTCSCTPYNGWHYWYEDGGRDRDMCNRCFWSREIGIFLEFFGVVYYPNTRFW